MYLRLHLLDLLDLRSSPTVLPSLLSTPVETNVRPIIKCSYLPYVAMLIGQSIKLNKNILWWTWRESNPRPEVLRFEGITTISYMKMCIKTNITIKTVTMN